MRYAILSDIHGNFEALEAVVEACQHQHVEHFLCAGDTVGYGANPKECLDFLRKYKITSVAGNHDWAVGGRLDASYFTDDGKEAIAWTRMNIPFEYYNYLNALQTTFKNNDLILTHACLKNPENFVYLRKLEEASGSFQLMDRSVCFIGHTHVPKIFIQERDKVFYSHLSEIEIDSECKYIINTGSVGQPRDGNPMASYGIYDTDLEIVELKRVEYDIATAQEKILEAGLPDFLARRLTVGK